MAIRTARRREAVIRPFGPHAERSLRQPKWLNVFEGSVRSGKTLASSMLFLSCIEMSSANYFMASGNTIGSFKKNVVDGDMGILAILPGSEYKNKDNTLMIPTSTGWKTVYVFGGGNVDSEDNLRGLTVGGWYADEIDKHHMTFIDMALTRSLTYKDRFNIWTMNPDNPQAPIYEKHIDRWLKATKEERMEVGGYNYYHFTLADNPIYSDIDIKRIGATFSGYEYDRYILGKRVRAEGLIYPGVATRPVFQNVDPVDVHIHYCSIDFGTDHPFAMYFGGPLKKGTKYDYQNWRIVHEVYDARKDKTTSDMMELYERACDDLGIDPHKVYVAIDPSAKVLRNEFIRHGYKPMGGASSDVRDFNAKNAVKSGIEFLRYLLYNGRLILSDSCTAARREFASYAYDPKAPAGEERPIKENDDAMDALRYFGYTHIFPRLRMERII